jgi:hypothetical protein
VRTGLPGGSATNLSTTRRLPGGVAIHDAILRLFANCVCSKLITPGESGQTRIEQFYTDTAAQRLHSWIMSDAGSVVATMLILGIASLLFTFGGAAVSAWLHMG